jgi:hypothetical protein
MSWIAAKNLIKKAMNITRITSEPVTLKDFFPHAMVIACSQASH